MPPVGESGLVFCFPTDITGRIVIVGINVVADGSYASADVTTIIAVIGKDMLGLIGARL